MREMKAIPAAPPTVCPTPPQTIELEVVLTSLGDHTPPHVPEEHRELGVCCEGEQRVEHTGEDDGL